MIVCFVFVCMSLFVASFEPKFGRLMLPKQRLDVRPTARTILYRSRSSEIGLKSDGVSGLLDKICNGFWTVLKRPATQGKTMS